MYNLFILQIYKHAYLYSSYDLIVFMPENEQDEEYSYEKSQFLDKVSVFIKSYIKMPIPEVIEQLKELITTYEQLFLDNDDDKDYVKDLKICLELYIDAQIKQQVLETPISKQERQEARKEAQLLQFNYDNSLWKKLFSQRSCHNDLYGQALYHIVLGIITDLKINTKDVPFLARPNLFYIQRSRSGKNQGMYFVEEVLKKIKKYKKEISIRRGGKQTDPTLLDRPEMEVTKGGALKIKKDVDNNPIIIPGLLSKTNLYWYPEANFLLNPTSKDNMEAVNIHLNLLESGGKYEKELAQWQGISTVTYGGYYSLVALTRPIHNIKLHILYSGLLPRCIFIPRQLTKEDRKIMRNQVVFYMHQVEEEKKEYKKNFNILIKELEEIQAFVEKTEIQIRDEDSEKIRADVNKKLETLVSYIEEQFLTEQNIEIIEDFIGNYTDHLSIFAFQTAAIRRSENVELVDYQYAYNFLKNCVDCFIPWLEETITEDKKHSEKIIIRSNKMKQWSVKHKGSMVKFSDAVRDICYIMQCSHMTARKYIFSYSELPYRYYTFDIDGKNLIFT